MHDYVRFAKLHHSRITCVFIYINEAHFVDRDSEGSIIEGWPVGTLEYPSQKTLDDRTRMAKVI